MDLRSGGKQDRTLATAEVALATPLISSTAGPCDDSVGFNEVVDLRLLQARLGELGPEQVYYPVPYPCLGGSGELSTFDRGDVWVFVDLRGRP